MPICEGLGAPNMTKNPFQFIYTIVAAQYPTNADVLFLSNF